jgi:hypothetical protein
MTEEWEEDINSEIKDSNNLNMPDERMEINEISMMMKYEGNPKTTSSIQ